MTSVLLIASGLGLVAGMRTFTAPASWFLAQGGGAGIFLAVAAVGEFVGDLLPTAPPRTSPVALVARVVSGGIVGWLVGSARGGMGPIGAAAGVVGALAGAYGGLIVRSAAIRRIGPVPAALAEDVVAVGLAAFLVTR